jgi:Ser/Thr protein kinase RdoA (MazF antagonist)
VSQHAVERTLGKLATDEEFRARFFENPATAAWEAGLPLSPAELEALSTLSRAAIARFSQSLDGRIRRLCLAGTSARAARRERGPRSVRCDAGAEDAT